ncbi:MAG: hypothetical protein AABY15_02810 [Nanoarchaeota archaeon]
MKTNKHPKCQKQSKPLSKSALALKESAARMMKLDIFKQYGKV